jgi:hypothetical protein
LTDEGRDSKKTVSYEQFMQEYSHRARTIRVFNQELVPVQRRTFELKVASDHYYLVFSDDFRLLESQQNPLFNYDRETFHFNKNDEYESLIIGLHDIQPFAFETLILMDFPKKQEC